MFQPITVVHLFFLTMFACLGLKGIFFHRGQKVGMHFVFGGQSRLYIGHSDVVLLFAVLSFMTVGESNFEFLNWARAYLDLGPKLARALLLSAYLAALICALAYSVIGVIFVVVSGVVVAFQKVRTGPGSSH